jgi:hypothetical protein
MFNNTRKYRLNVEEIKSHGISASTKNYEYNLLNNFSINNTTYPQLSTEELANLNIPDYLNRVCDYLTYVNIEREGLRENLINNALTYTSDCEIKCDLNSDFLVYRFLTGVRVVNIGEFNGTVEYKAYPIENDSSGYTWQTNGTFLSLDLNKIYVFEVRDVVDGEEFCKVQRTVSLPTLVQSTTFTPEEKLVYLNEVACGSTNLFYYNNGTINIDPSLTNDEIICVDYKAFADAYGDAESCVQLFCKPNNCNTYLNYSCHTSDDGLQSGNFILRSGDQMCYNLNNIVPTAGSCSCTCFEIYNVNGGGTTTPSIDESRSCVTRHASIPREDIVVNLDESIVYSNDFCEKKTGNFVFSPSIPENECLTLELNDSAILNPYQSSASASVVVKCKPEGGTNYDTLFTNTPELPAPATRDVEVKYDDSLCYELEVETVNGTTGTSCISIIDILTQSNGINTTIGSSGSTSVEKYVEPLPAIVSVCQQNETYDELINSKFGNGYINISPNIMLNQCVSINFSGEFLVFSADQNINNSGTVVISCKRAIDTNYSIKCTMQTNGSTATCTGNIFVCSGDTLCYSISARAATCGTSVSTNLKLNNTNGFNGIDPTISATKDNHCISVSYTDGNNIL